MALPLHSLDICWVEGTLVTNFEADTLPLLFARDEDFLGYSAAMALTHSRKARLLSHVQAKTQEARDAFNSGEFGGAIAFLADAVELRKTIFAQDDYQILAAEVHLIWSSVHLATNLLHSGRIEESHDMFVVAHERLSTGIFHRTKSSTVAPHFRPTSRMKTPSLINHRHSLRVVKARIELVLHNNWANYWAQEQRWNMVALHCLRAVRAAESLGVRSQVGEPDVVPLLGSACSIPLQISCFFVARSSAAHIKAHTTTQHFLSEIDSLKASEAALEAVCAANRQANLSSFTVPGSQNEDGDNNDAWKCLASHSLEINLLLGSRMEAFVAPEADVSFASMVVALSSLCRFSLMNRRVSASRMYLSQLQNLMVADPSHSWTKITQSHQRAVATAANWFTAHSLTSPSETRDSVTLTVQRLIMERVASKRAEKLRQLDQKKMRSTAEGDNAQPEGDIQLPARRAESCGLLARPQNAALAQNWLMTVRQFETGKRIDGPCCSTKELAAIVMPRCAKTPTAEQSTRHPVADSRLRIKPSFEHENQTEESTAPTGMSQIVARQQRLRSVLPSLDSKSKIYRDVINELAKNETFLRQHREQLKQQRLTRDADKIAARAGMSNTWKHLKTVRDIQL